MIEEKKFSSIRALDGISERTMTEHDKLYGGYVKKFNEIETRLKTVELGPANQVFSDVRSLKLELSFALSGVKNHESYFGSLGGDGALSDGRLRAQIEKDFGDFDRWRDDLVASGLAARGWVYLVYDHDLNRLFNHIGDSQNTYLVWNGTLLLAMDVYEHAYFIDFGVRRTDYIQAFLRNIDWGVVEERFDQLKLR